MAVSKGVQLELLETILIAESFEARDLSCSLALYVLDFFFVLHLIWAPDSIRILIMWPNLGSTEQMKHFFVQISEGSSYHTHVAISPIHLLSNMFLKR